MLTITLRPHLKILNVVTPSSASTHMSLTYSYSHNTATSTGISAYPINSASGDGFEPPLGVLETLVLPLTLTGNNWSIGRDSNPRFYGFADHRFGPLSHLCTLLLFHFLYCFFEQDWFESNLLDTYVKISWINDVCNFTVEPSHHNSVAM